jgi:hypothetical protein
MDDFAVSDRDRSLLQPLNDRHGPELPRAAMNSRANDVRELCEVSLVMVGHPSR